MYFSDTVPFVIWQLEHYGIWGSRQQIANIVGCSVTTVRRYENCHLKHPKLLKELKKFPFPNRQIKTGYDDDFYGIWIIDDNDEITFVKSQSEIKSKSLKPYADEYNLILKYGYQTQFPKTTGLYMLAQSVTIPNRINEHYFLIKIGASTANLHNRITDYKGMNPFAVCVDVYEVEKKNVLLEERHWHNLMDKKYLRANGTEWFVVPKNDYIQFLKKGFDIKL